MDDHLKLKSRSWRAPLAAATLLTFIGNGHGQELRLNVDVSQPQQGMIVKSKLGFARAASFKELPESIAGLRDIQPRIFCSELDFDDVEAPNYALVPEPFGDGTTPIKPNAWIQTLDRKLRAIGTEPHFQIIGAPLPYQQRVIRRPAIHPTPTDIERSAELTARWIDANFADQRGQNWLIWNEPSHTLRGFPTSVAAKDMAEIFNAYEDRIRGNDSAAQLGYASFIAHSLKNVPESKGLSFLERVFEYTNQKQPLGSSLDFVSINNYFGKTEELLLATDKLLGKFGSTAPIVFSQFAPKEVSDKSVPKNDVFSATNYLTRYDQFVKNPTVKHVCFSYWTGASNQSFYRFHPKSGRFLARINLRALQLYQRLGTWRAPMRTSENGVFAVAAYEDSKITVLVSNTAKVPRPMSLDVTGNEKDWVRAAISTATEEGTATETITTKPASSSFSIALAPESITLVNLEKGPVRPPADTTAIRTAYINNNNHVHRSSGRRGAGFFDSQLMRFSAEVVAPNDVAHSSVRLREVPQNTKLTLFAPNNAQLATALQCLSLQAVSVMANAPTKVYKDKSNPLDPKTLQEITGTTSMSANVTPLVFYQTGSSASTSIASVGRTGEIRLHTVLKKCPQPVQVLVQLHQ